ncbi:MAG: hypothetical protein GVY30_00420 [Chloroflexi bacterium]|jgi:hypothetical protein|nr:hypothetical protein [Chloroflexota bacterium]
MGLDELLIEVPDQIERRYLEEAVKCYHIEAYRAAVILSWIVVARNLERKLQQLSREDGEANSQWERIEEKKSEDKSYEEDLLNACKSLGVLDGQETEELKHLRNTRNWCAHPTNYEPTAEAVRDCLRNAVQYALSRPLLRGFVYIRSLATERITTPSFFPSDDPNEIDTYVDEMLGKIRMDLHIRLAEEMIHTFQNPDSTVTTRKNIKSFLSSMMRQSSEDIVASLTHTISPLLDADLRSGAVILSSHPKSFGHLQTLKRDRLKNFVIEEVTASVTPDPLMIRVLEAIISSGSVDNEKLQQMSDNLHSHIYDLYSQLEDQAAPFFVNILIERLESDLARTRSGERGTDFDRANPAAQFVQEIGLDNFDSQPVEVQQQLADALAVAASENAFKAKSILTSTARLSNEWLQLLLDGLAHHFTEHYLQDPNVLASPMIEWVSRGHDLTPTWKDFLQRALDEHESQLNEMDHPYPTIPWYPKTRRSIRRVAEVFKQVTPMLREKGYDASLAQGFLEYLKTVHPNSFPQKLQQARSSDIGKTG